jgi:uncharacterized Zn finger protein
VGDGGHCKHVAALLFTYSANPHTFPEAGDALAEGAPGDAVEIAGAMLTGSVPNLSILSSVAEAAEAAYPADAAWLDNRIAELLIARQNRPDYAEAAAIIRRLRDLHQRQGRADEAQAAVKHFRSEYKRFRAFQEELSRAGIPL